MNLMSASNEWSTRPADERFWNLQDMKDAADTIRARAVEAIPAPLTGMRFDAGADGSMGIIGASGARARLGHYAFSQASSLMNAPADYLRRLPAPLAADCLNNGMRARVADGNGDRQAKLLLDRGADGFKARAITSQQYCRIWNGDIIPKLQEITLEGWRTPPARPAFDDARARPATEADCLKNRMPGLGIQPGAMIAPAGLYMSEKDMFVFMVNENKSIDIGAGETMNIGFFLSNSEVGDKAFSVTKFGYRAVCGNHIVWDSKQVENIRLVHKGAEMSSEAFKALSLSVTTYADESVSELEGVIATSRRIEIAATKDDVLNVLFGKRALNLPRATFAAAYDACEQNPSDSAGASPRSPFGIAHGLTRISQLNDYTDARTKIDTAAGKLLAMSF